MKPTIRNAVLATLVAAPLLLSPLAAQAARFGAFVEFSGALSDTGNYASTHGESPAPFWHNRTTNGPVAGELLAARMGFEVKSSNHLVGPAQGTNFAVRDALASANGPDDLPNQLKAYLEPRAGKADPDAFFFVFNGGNDVIVAATQLQGKASEKMVDDAVAGLEKALRTLIKGGARTIMAPNFIDISVLPAVRGTPIEGHAKHISETYNRKFEAMLARVEKEERFRFIHWDFARFLKGVIAHGQELGFTNTSDSCEALKASNQCNPDTFVYLNEVFPTAKVHEFIAQAMAVQIATRDVR